MSEKYAVLEWEKGKDDIADVIAKDESRSTAELLVKIAPKHLPREIVEMDELNRLAPMEGANMK